MGGKWSLQTWIAIGMILFNVGMNWGRLTGKQESDGPFVRQDVYNVERKALTDSIDRLTAAVEQQPKDMNRLATAIERLLAIEEKTGEPARIQRQADRGMFDK